MLRCVFDSGLRARRATSPTEDTRYLPRLEILEPRLAMTASLSACDNLPLMLSHGGACSCPICSGQNLVSLFPADIAQSGTTGSGGPSSASPISALPQLSSNSGARAILVAKDKTGREFTYEMPRVSPKQKTFKHR